MKKRISRSTFLRWAALATAGGAIPTLAACQAPPASTAAPPEAPKPTTAPAAQGAPPKPPEPTKATEAPKPAEAPKPTQAASGGPASPVAAQPVGAKSPVTLRVHIRAGDEKAAPAELVTRPAEWEKETGNKIVWEPVPGGNDYPIKIVSLAAGNTIGDLLFATDIYQEHTRYVRLGIVHPVDDLLTSAGIKKSEWLPAIIEGMTINGKMYGMPRAGHPGDSYIWVNLKMFDDAGIKRPETYGTTFEQLADWANRLSKGPKDRRDVYGYSAGVKATQAITNGVRQMGSDVVDRAGKTSLADSDGWWQWAQWHNQLMAVDRVHPSTESLPSNGLVGMFAAEKVAMVHQQRSFERASRLAVQGKFPIVSIQFPRGPKAVGWGMSINTWDGTATSRFKEEVFSLQYAQCDRRTAYLVGKEQGYLTGRTDNLDALMEVADDPFLKLQQRCSEESSVYWRADNMRALEVVTAIENQMDLVWLGKTKLERSTMTDLKATLDGILARPLIT